MRTWGLADDLAQGPIGRKLPRMFVDAGFDAPEITPHPVRLSYAFNELFLSGYLTRLQADERLRPDRVRNLVGDQLRTTVADQTYFVTVTSVIAAVTV
jgi:hypothetical protein